MDKALLASHLAQAEHHVIQGIEHIARQKTMIAELEGHGQDATEARRFLDALQDMQATHEAHRDRLRRELEPTD